MHSDNGWVQPKNLIQLIDAIMKMKKMPFSLLFDGYRFHRNHKFHRVLKKRCIKPIIIPANGTPYFQPEGISYFGILTIRYRASIPQ